MAIPNPVPTPHSPAGPGPKLAPAPPKDGASGWRIGLIAVVIAAGAWAGYRYFAQPAAQGTASGPAAAGIRTAKVTSGTIQRTLRLTGSTTAKNYRSVAAPRMQAREAGTLTLIYLAPSGSTVKKGDVVAQIDAQALKDHVDDIQAQIAEADANIRKRRAEQALNWENLQQTIRVAKSRLDKARLDASAAEIRTIIDAELVKLAVEESEATYKEQLADLSIRKESDQSDLRQMELDRELRVRHRDRHIRDIENFTMRAPIDGLVVMQTLRRARELVQVEQGDQVAPAQPFMKIVDLNSMQVEATVSQVEAEEMRMNQRAEVYFDAFPGLMLPGKVSQIGAIAIPGARANYFLRTVPVFLKIDGRDDRVIPDLSTSANVLIDQSGTAPLVPMAAVESHDGKSFVRVKKGDGFESREVKLGLTDRIRAAVVSGLKEGEEVALVETLPGEVAGR
jgi:HlyD family secretion protein